MGRRIDEVRERMTDRSTEIVPFHFHWKFARGVVQREFVYPVCEGAQYERTEFTFNYYYHFLLILVTNRLYI